MQKPRHQTEIITVRFRFRSDQGNFFLVRFDFVPVQHRKFRFGFGFVPNRFKNIGSVSFRIFRFRFGSVFRETMLRRKLVNILAITM